MDPEPFGPPSPSCLDLIIQHNKYIVHNGQLENSDLSASIVDIQLNINQLNFSFYIERIQQHIESESQSPGSSLS